MSPGCAESRNTNVEPKLLSPLLPRLVALPKSKALRNASLMFAPRLLGMRSVEAVPEVAISTVFPRPASEDELGVVGLTNSGM